MTATPRRHLPWWLQLVVPVGLTAACLVLLVPRLPDEERSVAALHHLSVPLVLLALVLELLSLAAYSVMSSLLFTRPRVGFPVLVRIDLTTTGLSHVLPAGGATAATVRLRLLQQAGVRTADVVAGATVQATAANLVLGCVFLVGVLLLVGDHDDVGSYLLAAGLVGLALAGAAALGVLLVRRADRVVGWTRRSRLPLLRHARVAPVLESLATRLAEMVHHPSRSGRVLGWAAASWLLDAAVLWVVLAAVGRELGLGPLLVVYGLGNLLAVVPLTPGGLGVVEGVMVPALVGFGVPGGTALVAVLGWRLWQFWLPIPVAGVCYLSLRVGRFAVGPTAAARAARRRGA